MFIRFYGFSITTSFATFFITFAMFLSSPSRTARDILIYCVFSAVELSSHLGFCFAHSFTRTIFLCSTTRTAFVIFVFSGPSRSHLSACFT